MIEKVLTIAEIDIRMTQNIDRTVRNKLYWENSFIQELRFRIWDSLRAEVNLFGAGVPDLSMTRMKAYFKSMTRIN